MQTHFSIVDQIHARAIEVSARYKRAEADLIDVLQQIEDHRVFLKRGHASLFNYVVTELGLGENIAYSLITVARKARQVPGLKMQLQTGAMTLSNARRVAAVLTPQNQSEWLSKACDLSSRQLEREIVQERPEEATPERASYVSSNRIKLELGLSEREMLRLRRVQDLISQSRKRALSLEEVIEALNSDYLRRHDPVEKAKRHRVRQVTPNIEAQDPPDSGNLDASSVVKPTEPVRELVTRRDASHPDQKRVPIPSAIRHQVNLRDQRRCAYITPDGSRCNQARWIEIHHKIPISQRGPNTADNLMTLCSAHHQLMHQSGRPNRRDQLRTGA